MTDECGAPEFFTGGAKLLGLPSPDGKIGPEAIEASVALANDMGVHHVKPSAISVTQATELGTVYGTRGARSPDCGGQTAWASGAHGWRAVRECAGASWLLAGRGYLEGGRRRALVRRLQERRAWPRRRWCSSIRRRAEDFERRRKRAGHLWSKLRYLSCQLLAYLEDDLWLHNARQANAMAARLAAGLEEGRGREAAAARPGERAFRGGAREAHRALEGEGFHFYRWPWLKVADGAGNPAGDQLCDHARRTWTISSGVRSDCPSEESRRSIVGRGPQPWNISST